MPYVISTLNQKGGVGKTTTVFHLSAALSRMGYPVLALDMDPQANLSLCLGLQHPSEVRWTVNTILRGDIEDGLYTPWYPTVEHGVSLIYGDIRLTSLEREMGSKAFAELTLQQCLKRMALEDNHIVLIDCPPSLSYLTVNALVASRYCLIPFASGSQFSFDGFDLVENLIGEIQAYNEYLDILGVLLNMHDGRKKIHRAMLGSIQQKFGPKAFQATISPSVKLEETSAEGKSIFQHDRKSTGARDFMALGREVLDRLGLEPLVQEATAEAEGGQAHGSAA